ncbi:sugar phosphate isomerase/epimerase [Rhodobacteraceae bacterium RKSG542]|uniref:sugar phosphate isomerase/epimerase family protein n=1 Tax=Pseudovibrio flavus TaxID=2529854 RepID=UPI0012BBD9C4|nr:sugar phosphate isomerase/epimerase [Pseudovibrio flavus]MTI18043.1 sugar phosphate isomerase/epimerase [Pseudovibrio flavus]
MNFSLQLYSARNFQPWSKVISDLAAMGYTQVEGFGANYEDPTATKALLDANGLTMPSGHFGINDLEGNLDECLKIAATLGIKNIYAPYLDATERPTDEKGWVAFAKRLAAVGEKVTVAGFNFGWHNHDFEFQSEFGGRTPMEIILTEAPEIDWEADIAWIVRGGHDPMEWIQNYGKRITAVHVKDIAPQGECADEDGWADVGHGVVAWGQILAALEECSRASIFVMEHDNPSDFDRFARRSIASVKMLEGV